jgi:8-oxo-dGTP pyrophosphatase MutT (NUDIX family)
MKPEGAGHTELTSAGGVVFRRTDVGPEFALIRVGHEERWQLPKGLVDEGETFAETAVREVREETGLDCRIVSPLDTIDYRFEASYDGPTVRYHKRVHFFLMESVSGDIADHDDEVEEVRWFGVDVVLATLTFESERNVMTAALAELRGENR